MKWIEVIEFRSFDPRSILLELDMAHHLVHAIGTAHIVAIKVYAHSTLTTDASIHIQHESHQVESQGSAFGLQLVSELQPFGIVNHTVWIEAQMMANHADDSTAGRLIHPTTGEMLCEK